LYLQLTTIKCSQGTIINKDLAHVQRVAFVIWMCDNLLTDLL